MYDIEERETIITTDDMSDKWCIYTRQRKYINLLQKKGYSPVEVECDGDKVIGAEFVIDLNKITFKNAIVKKREYTDEERAAIRERLKK